MEAAKQRSAAKRRRLPEAVAAAAAGKKLSRTARLAARAARAAKAAEEAELARKEEEREWKNPKRRPVIEGLLVERPKRGRVVQLERAASSPPPSLTPSPPESPPPPPRPPTPHCKVVIKKIWIPSFKSAYKHGELARREATHHKKTAPSPDRHRPSTPKFELYLSEEEPVGRLTRSQTAQMAARQAVHMASLRLLSSKMSAGRVVILPRRARAEPESAQQQIIAPAAGRRSPTPDLETEGFRGFDYCPDFGGFSGYQKYEGFFACKDALELRHRMDIHKSPPEEYTRRVVEALKPTSKPQPLTPEPQPSTSVAQPSTSEPQPSTSSADPQPSAAPPVADAPLGPAVHINHMLRRAACSKEDVSKLFLAALCLASEGSVAVVPGSPLQPNSCSLQLLSEDEERHRSAAADVGNAYYSQPRPRTPPPPSPFPFPWRQTEWPCWPPPPPPPPLPPSPVPYYHEEEE